MGGRSNQEANLAYFNDNNSNNNNNRDKMVNILLFKKMFLKKYLAHTVTCLQGSASNFK